MSLGLLLGALVGLVFGALLFNGSLAPSGWERLFSLFPAPFHFMWTMFGAALGLMIGGVVAILLTNPERYKPDEVEVGHQ